MGGGEQGMETKFPDREQIEAFIEFLSAGNLSEATNLLAEIATIQPDNAARIISDAMGEPLSIAMKAIGTNRARFGEIIEILKNSDFGIIAAERNTAELQNIFDSHVVQQSPCASHLLGLGRPEIRPLRPGKLRRQKHGFLPLSMVRRTRRSPRRTEITSALNLAVEITANFGVRRNDEMVTALQC